MELIETILDYFDNPKMHGNPSVKYKRPQRVDTLFSPFPPFIWGSLFLGAYHSQPFLIEDGQRRINHENHKIRYKTKEVKTNKKCFNKKKTQTWKNIKDNNVANSYKWQLTKQKSNSLLKTWELFFFSSCALKVLQS